MKVDIETLRQHGLNRLDLYVGSRLVAKLLREGKKYMRHYGRALDAHQPTR